MWDFTTKMTNLVLEGGASELAVDVGGRPMLGGTVIPLDVVERLDTAILLRALNEYENKMKSNLLQFKKVRLGYDG